MLTRLLVFLTSISPWLRRVLWRWWYNKLAKQIGQAEWTFMNYGFRAGDGEFQLELKAEDERDRFCIQLYERVMSDCGPRVRSVAGCVTFCKYQS